MSNVDILWAQDRINLYLTLEILNIKEQDITFETRLIKFVGKNDVRDFDFQIDLHGDIDPESGTWQVRPNCVKITLKKIQNSFWNRLTKTKQNNVKIDWQKWVNEDDSEDSDENDTLLNNFQDFKKQLPSELLEKDFTELLGDDNQEISESDSENVDMTDEIIEAHKSDSGFDANGEDTSLYENSGEDLGEMEVKPCSLDVEELDVERLEGDIKEELQDIVPPLEEVEDSNSMGVENLNL